MDRMLLYHDFTSPYCRLAAQVAAEAARQTGLSLRAVPFELCPAPAPLPDPDQLLRDELARASAAAADWGLALGSIARVPRTRKAHEAVAYARAHDVDERVLHGIYRALWEEGRDVSRLDVLADIGEAAGLDREAMHVALGLDEFEPEVMREQEAAAAAGLTGVPAMQVRDVVAMGLFPVAELVDCRGPPMSFSFSRRWGLAEDANWHQLEDKRWLRTRDLRRWVAGRPCALPPNT
jgi:predicted DsbA family dithiol-disulfide isomerase